MKNIIFTLLIATAFSYNTNAQDKNIPLNQIPKQITEYLNTHFPNNTVLEASFDDHVKYKKYEIELNNKISLEFSTEFKVTEIKSKDKLPDSVIPTAILTYVKTNYPNNTISDWEIDKGNQQIELNNGIDLIFNLKGEFLRVEK